ncbi:hypothetical protein LUZ60_005859 [Juncus effusus]|nr:hypothetical protein LUZ60_005859 [Juncus effusus]
MAKASLNDIPTKEHVSVIQGPIIIGAGPSGLAVAASLTSLSIPYIILERSTGIADLWTNRTYNRLSLHLPKWYCELPYLPFPPHFPTYPSKAQFLHYLNTYTSHFSIDPLFSHTVMEAKYDNVSSLWRVEVNNGNGDMIVYMSKWIVVATGENAEPTVPKVKGQERFKGGLMHSSEYKNGEGYKGKKILVIGCGNSGMEICLDLYEHGALPFMSVRNGVHVLPRKMFGTYTFGLAMNLLQWFPVKWVDKFLIMASNIILGDAQKYGLKRPKLGPLESKGITGKSPVLDIGALALIKSGSIKDCEFFTSEGKPKTPFPNGWKGENGIYTAGFTGKGLLGASLDAMKVAQDIAEIWSKIESKYDSVV